MDIGAHLESHYSCGICKQLLFEPVTLLCQHTFCRYCLVRHMKTDHKCPNCQKRFFLPASNTNFQMRDAIDELLSMIYDADEIQIIKAERVDSQISAEIREKVIADLRKEIENSVLDNVMTGHSDNNHNHDDDEIVVSKPSYFMSFLTIVGSMQFLNACIAFGVLITVPCYLYKFVNGV